VELTPADIQEILRIFVDSELRDLQLQVGDVRLAVSKNEGAPPTAFAVAPVATPPPAPPPSPSPEPSTASLPAVPTQPVTEHTERLLEVRSPLVGVFYRRPAPDAPSYVEVGDVVDVGDPVCTIEIMKMFTEVKAEVRGRVAEITVADAAFVEPGQVLMLLEPVDS
jgi:acetyl-CoA carboxylase biotin carboxyl carrier protein